MLYIHLSPNTHFLPLEGKDNISQKKQYVSIKHLWDLFKTSSPNLSHKQTKHKHDTSIHKQLPNQIMYKISSLYRIQLAYMY